ncbi:hypothetical protein QG044_10155 [Kingella kingae]|uniref:hypothetical protein n=1 Tax=Kingella kingae TaxID=504 RepID=UPI0003FFBEA6|nr:hypothetical protein [Kingella kingae]MDK4577083.1 hypothetical protein [Kingella kingae]MDK4583118.1 hypothetical protein [Kingella kingae]MDK4593288.1 hypothetical protein [Kingella kingae]MDK4595310.1 hypothetical protein [Kingella kingae]MDK4605496.1 hypothetical protein [Kingella kingae]
MVTKESLEAKLEELQHKVNELKNNFSIKSYREVHYETNKLKNEIFDGYDNLEKFKNNSFEEINKFTELYSTKLNDLSIELNDLIHQENEFNKKSYLEMITYFASIFLAFVPILLVASSLSLFLHLNHLGLVNLFPLIVTDIGFIPIITITLTVGLCFLPSFIPLLEDKNKLFKSGVNFIIHIFRYIFSSLSFFLFSNNYIVVLICGIVWLLLCIQLNNIYKNIKFQKRYGEIKYLNLVKLIILGGLMMINVSFSQSNKSIFNNIYRMVRISESDIKIFKLNPNFQKNLTELENQKLTSLFKANINSQLKFHENVCQSKNYLVGNLVIKTKNFQILCPADKNLDEKKKEKIGDFCYQFSAGGSLGDDLIDVTLICKQE